MIYFKFLKCNCNENKFAVEIIRSQINTKKQLELVDIVCKSN